MSPFHQHVSRRELLRAGGLTTLGLGLPEFLQASAPSARRGGSEKSCIFIMQCGGASQVDTLDPKPDAAEEFRGPYQAIETRVPGTRLTEKLPRLAELADRYCLVRSLTHRMGAHVEAIEVCMTGHSRPASNTPYVGSVMAKVRPSSRNMPSYVWLVKPQSGNDIIPYLSGGFLGAAYSPLALGTGQDLGDMTAPRFRVRPFPTTADVSPQRVEGRRTLLQQLEPASSPHFHSAHAGNLRRFQERAVDLLTGPDAQRAFDLEQEAVPLRDRYGRNPLGQNLLLARRLVEAGVRLVTVNAWPGMPPGHKGSATNLWDSHGGDNGNAFDPSNDFSVAWLLPPFDHAVSALLLDLEQRGLLESTLVVVVGEFGRGPKVDNYKGNPGRNHWPYCYSALLAGAGIRGGMVYGASDKIGGYPKDNPVPPESFAATLFHALGVSPETRLGADGFTHPVSTGQPILDLF